MYTNNVSKKEDDMKEAAKRKMKDDKKKKKVKKQPYFTEQILNRPIKRKKLKLIAKPINQININKPEDSGIVIGTLQFK